MIYAWQIDKEIFEILGLKENQKSKKSQKIKKVEMLLKSLLRLMKACLIVFDFMLCSKYKRNDSIYRGNYRFVFFYCLNFLFEKKNTLKSNQSFGSYELLGLVVNGIEKTSAFLVFMGAFFDKKVIKMELALNISKQSLRSKINVMALNVLLIDLETEKFGKFIDIQDFQKNKKDYLLAKYGSELLVKLENIICKDVQVKRLLFSGVDLDFQDFQERAYFKLIEEKKRLSELSIQRYKDIREITEAMEEKSIFWEKKLS